MSIRRRRPSSHAHSVVNQSAMLELLENRLLLSAGDLDTSFGDNGTVCMSLPGSASDIGYATAIQADGKIIMVGRSGPSATLGGDFSIARFNVDGTPDVTFGHAGLLVTDLGGNDTANAVVIQPDGKIVVAGFSVFDGPGAGYASLIRCNADGTLDATFVNTYRSRSTQSYSESYCGLALQPDGQILAVGSIGGTSGVARYTTTGQPDLSFGNGGRVYSVSTMKTAKAVAVQPDGQIVIAGSTYKYDEDRYNHFALTRLNANGTLDTSFGSDGTLSTTFISYETDIATAVAIQPDGKIVAAGTSKNNFILARYNANGSLDSGFDADGKVTVDFGATEAVTALALQPDGNVLVAGFTGSYSAQNFALARIRPDGSMDSTFGNAGKVVTSLVAGNDAANGLALQADGRIVAVGFSVTGTRRLEDMAAVRYNADGSVDTSFGQAGIVAFDAPWLRSTSMTAMAVQSDGKLVVAGSVGDKGGPCFTVARFLSDGQLDTAFGRGGQQQIDFGLSSSVATGVVVLSDGRIVAGGYGNGNFLAACMMPDGTLDTTFDGDGLVTVDFGADDRANALTVQSDGKFLLAGTSGPVTTSAYGGAFAVARLNADGTLDLTFDGDGKTTTKPSYTSGTSTIPILSVGTAVAVQPDGRIVVAGVGVWEGYNGLIRYMADGSLDAAFGNHGIVARKLASSNGDICGCSLALQNDGKIVTAGTFPSGDSWVARYTTNGTLDTTFSSDGVSTFGRYWPAGSLFADISPRGIVVQSDGRIVGAVGGTRTPLELNRLTAGGWEEEWFSNVSSDWLSAGVDNMPQAIAVQPDGQLVVAGYQRTSHGSGPSKLILSRYDGIDLAAQISMPSSVDEGRTVTCSARVSVDVLPAQYEWDLDYDGTTFTPDAAGLSVTLDNLDGPSLHHIAFRVTDSRGVACVKTADLQVNNVLPVLTVTTPPVVRTNTEYTLGLSSVDPGDDTISSWTIDWGDGQVQTIAGNPQAATHRYAQAGQYVIVASAQDEDGQYAAVDSDVTAQPGYLDPSWGSEGYVSTAFDLGGSGTDTMQNFVVQPDGRIVATGITLTADGSWHVGMIRMNADGSLDSTFGTAGRVIGGMANSDGYEYSVAIQSDGKILLAGQFDEQLAVMRYNGNGTVDQSFGVNGVATAGSHGEYCFARGLVVQANGKIVSCGWLDYGPAVICWTSNGRLDASFSGDGIALLPDAHVDTELIDLALQSNGKIVVFGRDAGLVLARYNTNGSLDNTFGIGGVRTDSSDEYYLDQLHDITIGSDGRIVLAGTDYYLNGDPETPATLDFLLMRYQSNGTRDQTFGDGGIVATDMGLEIDDISSRAIVLPDGKILASGWASGWDSSRYAAAVRYNFDGSLDTTFGDDGKVMIGLPGSASDDWASQGVAVLPNGQILLAGQWNSDFSLVRLSPGGALDTTFGRAGYAHANFPAPTDTCATAMLAQPDGKILLAGYSQAGNTSDAVLARYHADGTLDRSFGVDGRVVADWGYSEYISSLALQSDGKIVAVGRLVNWWYGDSGLGWIVARFNRDGSPDTTFGLGGAQILLAGTISTARDLVIQPNGQIVVAGSVQVALNEEGLPISNFALARFNVDGSLDAGFGVEGWSVFEQTQESCAYSVALQQDGQIVAVGTTVRPNDPVYRQDFMAVRLTPDGHRDPSFRFSEDGGDRISFSQDGSGIARSVAILPDGKILIAGDDETNARLFRLSQTGQLDTSFGEDGSVCRQGVFDSMLLQPDGRIILLANHGWQILRYNADGSVNADSPLRETMWLYDWYAACDDLVVDNQGRMFVAGQTGFTNDLTIMASASGYSTVRVVDTLPVMLTGDSLVDEGHDATVSFVNVDDPTGMRFSYDFDNDGVFEIIDSDSPTAVVPGSYLTDVASRTVRATVRGADGRLSDYITSIAVHNLPPTVQSVVINDGAAQRSRIQSITVTFDQKMRNWPEAYLRLQGDSEQNFYICMQPAGWDESMPEQDGYRTFVYRFSETLDGWLADGQYDLVIGTWNEDLFGESMASEVTVPLHQLGGDANGDSAVDVGDLGILGVNYGRTGTNLPGDMNLDGAVDVGDLGILGANYGQALPGGATMAAPAAMAAGIPEASDLSPVEFAVKTPRSACEQAEPVSLQPVDADSVQGHPSPAMTEASIEQAWLAPSATGLTFGVIDQRSLLGSLDATPDVLELALLDLPL